MVRQARILEWARESQYYAEPKRLARLGYLDSHTEPGRTRDRIVYTLTERGLAALREYARTPVSFQPVKSDLLLRLLICDLVGEAPTRESAGTLRAEIADLEARLDEFERSAESLPHRRKYLLLAIAPLQQQPQRVERMLGVRGPLVPPAQRDGEGRDVGEVPQVAIEPKRVPVDLDRARARYSSQPESSSSRTMCRSRSRGRAASYPSSRPAGRRRARG